MSLMRFSRATPWLALFAALVAGCDSPTAGRVGGTPARLELLSGDAQQGVVGRELVQPLVARITDAGGDPVVGYVVNFRVTAGGGDVFAGAAATGADGVVRDRWTLGTSTADSQRVEVRALDPVTGQAVVHATFRATALADAPAGIGAVDGAALLGSAGFPLADSLAARVTDRFGNPVPGATVAWSVLAGGGAASPAQSRTDAAGVARTQWVLGTFVTGAQRVQAAAGAGLTTEFAAQAGTPAAAVLAVHAGNAQAAAAGTALPQPLTVSVRLADGRPLVGAPVVWTTGPGGGTVTPSTSFTDSAGHARAQWVLPTLAGTATVVAAAPGLMPVGFTATVRPGPAATLERVSGNGQRGRPGRALALPLVVRARDAHGNAVAGAAVQWSASSGGTVSPPASTTGADGTASVAWTLGGGVGVQQATAASGSLPPVSFSATSEGAIQIAVDTPRPDTVVGDTLRVAVRIVSSTSSVTSITARVMDRVVNVQAGTPVTLVLTGLVQGPHVLQVRAHAVNGDTGLVEVPFIYDRRPTLVVDSPADYTVARPELRVDADCRDDDPLGCAKVEAHVMGPGIHRTLVASGTTSLHTMVSLARWDHRTFTMEISAMDRRGQWTAVTRLVHVESGPGWTELVTAPGRLLDFDAGRALYAAPDRSVRIANRDGSGETTTQPVASVSKGWLHPQGAILALGQDVHDWRSGVLTRLDGYSAPLRVAGTWAVWTGASGYTHLYRRDLATGTTLTVATDAGNTTLGVAANGDVAFWNSSYDIVRYRDGVLTPLTSGADGVTWNLEPVTDGVNVVFRKSPPCCNRGLHQIAMITADGDEVVLTPPAAREPIAGLDYAANGGWVAFTMIDAGGARQVWTRSPAGVVRQATTLSTDSGITGLGPDGQLAFTSWDRTYLALPPYTSEARYIGGPARMEWRGSQLIAFVGRSAFSISY